MIPPQIYDNTDPLHGLHIFLQNRTLLSKKNTESSPVNKLALLGPELSLMDQGFLSANMCLLMGETKQVIKM